MGLLSWFGCPSSFWPCSLVCPVSARGIQFLSVEWLFFFFFSSFSFSGRDKDQVTGHTHTHTHWNGRRGGALVLRPYCRVCFHLVLFFLSLCVIVPHAGWDDFRGSFLSDPFSAILSGLQFFLRPSHFLFGSLFCAEAWFLLFPSFVRIFLCGGGVLGARLHGTQLEGRTRHRTRHTPGSSHPPFARVRAKGAPSCAEVWTPPD